MKKRKYLLKQFMRGWTRAVQNLHSRVSCTLEVLNLDFLEALLPSTGNFSKLVSWPEAALCGNSTFHLFISDCIL